MGAARTLTVGTIGLLAKAALNLGYCAPVRVEGLHVLLDALASKDRDAGRGIVTGAQAAPPAHALTHAVPSRQPHLHVRVASVIRD
jgi:hypothetical protein